MHRNLFSLGRVAALLALGAPVLLAQGSQTANATIDVVDAAGAAVASVTVRLTSPALQGVRTGITDASGRFVARLLPPGRYQIEVVKEGFQTAKLTQNIGIDQNFQPRVVLQKTASAVVEVVAAASPALDKSDVKTASNYNMDSIDALPNGRTMEAVAFLTPGVTGGVGGRVQIRGAQTSGNLYLVDGQNVADNAYNNRGVLLIDDAIEETQIITGAISAEYGNIEGGVLNSITKSGSNTFTGLIRWDLTNPSWNAAQPYQSRTVLANKASEFKTYTLGGYFIKDRLWFFGAFYSTDSTGTGAISSNAAAGPNGAGAGYVTTVKEYRRTGKLTYLINSDHTFVYSFGNSKNNQGNRNYSAGELAALVPQTNTSEYWNMAFRSVWSSALTSEARIGGKKQVLSAGATNQALSPIYDYSTGFFYNNGIFDSSDGGDGRNNKTANLKGTYFFSANGQHQLDFGFDYYKGIKRAKNAQSVTGYTVGVGAWNSVNRTGIGVDIWRWITAVGEATSVSNGLYVNDKWEVNKNLSLQLGVRLDNYKATREDGGKSAGASGLSPRLGLKYDVFGDQVWLLGASFARYNGPVLEGVTAAVTNQGNPTEIDYEYVGPAGQQPTSVLYNFSNYNMTTSGITYYNNPTVNVRLNDKMKAPTVNEFQVSAARSFANDILGNGFVSLTAVTKTWANLMDYRAGNDGQVADATGSLFWIKVWDNSSIAERKYRGLEFAASTTKGAFKLDGNISWSRLEGNYEGEGGSQPGRGEGLDWFTSVNGVRMYDRNVTAPYGFLAGHMPLAQRWTGSYISNNAYGKTTWGLVYRFNSGSHYSDARTITRAMLNPALPSGFGTTATQYRDNKRGAYVLNGQATLDLAVTHDFAVFNVVKTPVRAFAKLVMTNFLNHQQIVSFATNSAAATTGLSDPWVRTSTYGTSVSSTNYGAARGITLSTGIRF